MVGIEPLVPYDGIEPLPLDREGMNPEVPPIVGVEPLDPNVGEEPGPNVPVV